jgi:hypothetical protein
LPARRELAERLAESEKIRGSVAAKRSAFGTAAAGGMAVVREPYSQCGTVLHN